MVNEERTKRYSWGVEATTSLFLEGGLLVVCNRLPFVGSLYGRARIRTEYARRDLLPGTDFSPGWKPNCLRGKVAPYLSFDIGGMYSPWSGMPFFAFVNPGHWALFPAPECRPHLSRSEISIYVAVSLSLQALFA